MSADRDKARLEVAKLMDNRHERLDNLTIQAVAERRLAPFIIRIKLKPAKLLLESVLSETVLLNHLGEELSWM